MDSAIDGLYMHYFGHEIQLRVRRPTGPRTRFGMAVFKIAFETWRKKRLVGGTPGPLRAQSTVGAKCVQIALVTSMLWPVGVRAAHLVRTSAWERAGIPG